MPPRATLLALAGFALSAEAAHAQQARNTDVGEVIVTASPLGGDPDRFATIVEAVKESEIQAHGGANLADALREVPGVAATGFASGASRPVIRGMDANRVKILEDGLASADVSDLGPDHGIPIDPLATRRIEVVRGAATLRYGSQAIGGVVNAIDDRIPLRLPEKGLEAEALVAGETNGGVGEGAVHLDGAAGQLAYHLDAYGRRASDYDTPLGVQTNSFFKGDGYALGGSYFFNGDQSRIGLAAAHYDAQYGLPSDETYIAMRQTRLISRSSFKAGMGALDRIDVDLGYADYHHDEIDPAGPSVESTFRNHELEGRVEALFGSIGPLSGAALGVQGSERRFEALGGGADYLAPGKNRSLAAFAFAEAPLGPVDLQGAVRVERVSVRGTPASGASADLSYTPVSASLGGSMQATPNLRLGLTFTRAARAPAAAELFARGPHDGPLTFETGDPGLKIERANSAEATARLNLGAARVQLSAWTARFQNYIHGQLTGRLCDDDGACAMGGPGDLKELNYIRADANFSGLEAKADIPLTGKLSLNLLADTVRAHFAHGGGDVPRIQPARIGGGLDWTTDTLEAGFMVLAVDAQDRPGTLESPTPGYTTLDAQIVWKPMRLSGVTVSLVGHNLTDEVVRNAVALNRDVVVQPGRDIRLTLVSRF